MADNDDVRAQARKRLQAKRAAADIGPKGPFLQENPPTGGLPRMSAEKTSVVFYRNGGYSMVTARGVRHVDRPLLARPYTVCEIVVGTFVTPLRIELPAAGSTAFFKAEVDIEWEVTDPHLVAVQAVKDVATRLTAPILERLREVTLSYRVTDAEQANRDITRECAGGRWSDLGAELGLRVRLYVRLGVDDDAIEHARKKRGVDAEAEVTRRRQDAFRRMLQGGELEQLSFMLAADPDGAKDFLEKIRQEGRQDEKERIDRLYAMAIAGELASTDVETQVLNLLNPKGRRPIQGPIGSLPPRRELEPATDGPFTPDWVSDEPPRRRSHGRGPSGPNAAPPRPPGALPGRRRSLRTALPAPGSPAGAPLLGTGLRRRFTFPRRRSGPSAGAVPPGRRLRLRRAPQRTVARGPSAGALLAGWGPRPRRPAFPRPEPDLPPRALPPGRRPRPRASAAAQTGCGRRMGLGGRGPMSAEGGARTSPDPVGPAPYGGRHGQDRAGERIAERLLTTVREDLGRADSKAAVLLSGTLALPAFLAGWRGTPGWDGLGDVTLILSGVLWAVAVAALVGALMPRTGTVRARDGVTYFGDLVKARDVAGLSARVTEAGRDPAGWLLVQAVDVSSILSAKYRAIRWGVGSLAPSAVLAVVWGLTAR